MAKSLQRQWTNVCIDNPYIHASWVCYDAEAHTIYKIQSIALLKYSFNTNSWIQLQAFNLFDKLNDAHHVTVACSDGTIFLYNGWDTIITFNTTDNTYEIHDHIINAPQTGFGCQGIMIENQFHIIGGSNNTKHLKWNQTNNTFETLYDLERRIGHHRLIKIKNRIQMLGGFDYGFCRSLDEVKEYVTITNEWNEVDITLPVKINGFGCILLCREQYIVLFGGQSKNVNDNILIYSLRNETFMNASIRCPVDDEFHAFNVNDDEKDELTVFGYVRCEWIRSQINVQLFPPEYLIRLMSRFYFREEIHLFSCRDCDKHWKIDVSDIIS